MKRTMLPTAIVLLAALCSGTSAQSAATSAPARTATATATPSRAEAGRTEAPPAGWTVQTLPMHRVVLYRNGVGYFERRGKVTGNAEIRLQVPEFQVQDVMRSLLVLDLGQGRIGAVSRDMAETATAGPNGLPLAIPEGVGRSETAGGLLGILAQLQGARVSLTSAGRTVTGVLLCVEQNTLAGKEETRVVQKVVVAGDDGEMASVELPAIQSLKVLDEGVRADIRQFAKVKSILRRKDASQDLRTVVVSSEGSGNRELVVSYIAAAPVWSTNYRLALNGEGKPFLQGWAAVENHTDESWDSVWVTLVSGTPANSVQPLPPRAQPARLRGGGYQLDGVSNASNFSSAIGVRSVSTAGAANTKETTVSDAVAGGAAGVSADTRTGQLGDLYEYRMDHPVRIGARQTAQIPVFQAALEGERVSIAGPGVNGHPASGLRVRNTTAVPLEGGTVVVYEGDAFAGETAMARFNPDDKIFLFFSQDPATLVSSAMKDANEPAFLAKAIEGQVKVYYNRTERWTYALENPTDRARVVYVSHPRKGTSWTLGPGAPTPVTAAPSAFLFRLELAPRQKAELVVPVSGPMMDVYEISDVTTDDIKFFLSKNYIDEPTRRALERIVELKARQETIRKRLEAIEEERQELDNEREKLQDGVKEVAESAEAKPLVQRYVAKLDVIEGKLDLLDKERKALQAEAAQLERDMDAAEKAVTMEKTLTPAERSPVS